MKTIISRNLKKYLNTIINVCFWIILVCIYFLNQSPKDLVAFLNVGQGDSVLIQHSDIQILIDGGPDRSILYELPKYMPFFDRKIEYLILTHPHDDHLVGLLHILENYEVGEILYYPVCYSNKNYEILLSSPIKKREIFNGDTIRIGTIEINSIWPIRSELTDDHCYKSYNGNINNDSVVLEIKYLDKNFLFMGDAEKEIEDVLLSSSALTGKYDVLKAGHHCSRTSNSETFLKYVDPKYAICSCGYKNKFNHPSSETIKKFSALNVQYFVTYESGNIVFNAEDMQEL